MQADSLPTELSGKPPVRLQCGRPGFDPWGVRIPWRRERLPRQYSGLENSMDCTVHGVAESDTTERLSLSFLCPDPPVTHAGTSLPEKAPPDRAAPWGRVSSSLLLSQSDCCFLVTAGLQALPLLTGPASASPNTPLLPRSRSSPCTQLSSGHPAPPSTPSSQSETLPWGLLCP